MLGLSILKPLHVRGPAGKEEAGEDLLYDRAERRERERGIDRAAHPFFLEKRVRDRADHHVVLPARIGAPFEVIELEFGLEVLIVLFDSPPLMRQSDQRAQRGRRGHRDQVVLGPWRVAEAARAQEPDFGRKSPMPPVAGRRDTDGGEIDSSRRIRSVLPRHPSPERRGEQSGQHAHTEAS
jgi:hypothetical protein